MQAMRNETERLNQEADECERAVSSLRRENLSREARIKRMEATLMSLKAAADAGGLGSQDANLKRISLESRMITK